MKMSVEFHESRDAGKFAKSLVKRSKGSIDPMVKIPDRHRDTMFYWDEIESTLTADHIWIRATEFGDVTVRLYK